MKSLTGQYECAHRSGLGLDYFTARLDRLTLYANGRFALIAQEKSRIMHAAKSLASGQQANMEAPEVRREGNYTSRQIQVLLTFDDGEQLSGEVQDEGIQFDKDYFAKVSESTMLPPAQRVKSNMEDIARGLKIASTIGGTVFKAARTIQDNLQTQPPAPANQASAPAPANQNQAPSTPRQTQTPPPVSSTPPVTGDETFFCDQCGQRVRPDKKFCNHCGAKLP